MEAWKTLLGLGCASLVAGCTFTLDTSVNDDDEIMFSDPFDFEDPGDEIPSVDDDDDATTDPEPTDPEPTDPEPMSMVPIEAFVCDADNANGECEQCVQTFDRCCSERATCGDNEACETQWQAFKDCMVLKNLGDPDSLEAQRPISAVDHVDECRSEAAPGGQSINLEVELDLLLSCVGMPFDEGGNIAAGELVDGDGLCTFGCYGLFSLE